VQSCATGSTVKHGLISAQLLSADPSLEEIVNAWSRLNGSQRASVLAIVRAVDRGACSSPPLRSTVGFGSVSSGGESPQQPACNHAVQASRSVGRIRQIKGRRSSGKSKKPME